MNKLCAMCESPIGFGYCCDECINTKKIASCNICSKYTINLDTSICDFCNELSISKECQVCFKKIPCFQKVYKWIDSINYVQPNFLENMYMDGKHHVDISKLTDICLKCHIKTYSDTYNCANCSKTFFKIKQNYTINGIPQKNYYEYDQKYLCESCNILKNINC